MPGPFLRRMKIFIITSKASAINEPYLPKSFNTKREPSRTSKLYVAGGWGLRTVICKAC